jgi:hypothetical protein
MGTDLFLHWALLGAVCIVPPIFLIYRIRSGEIAWGHGFAAPRAKRSVNPRVFWLLVGIEVVVMFAADVMVVILTWRGR